MALWILAASALLLWVIAIAFKVTVGAIHLLLVAAVLLFIIGFFQGRERAQT